MPVDRATAEALFHEGNRHLADGRLTDAGQCFENALALAPDLAEAQANLAIVLERQGMVDAAEAAYRRALDLNPGHLQIYLNLGVLLTNGKRFRDAEAIYRQALAQTPDAPAAWSYYGVMLACAKREMEAESCYQTALQLDPDYRPARFNLAYLQLRQGRLAEGWASLEARDRYDNLRRHFNFPRWRGEALSGETIVIGFEAGHGDMIQFARYASLLKRMGAAEVALICHPGLQRLFGTLAGVDRLLAVGEDIPTEGWDFWTPPLSLPHYCRTTLDTIPASVPYLSAEPAGIADWAARLSGNGRRVGLVWKGNPRFENDADRSLPDLSVLAPLGGLAGIDFISLQKGTGEDEALAPPPDLHLQAFGGQLTDFADTAALIANLDLVISVDTAVAHLAGALGKPCWVLLPDFRTDWRWLTGRNDSPWYPSLRLFRQPAGGDWLPVVSEVQQALESWLKPPSANA